VEPLLRVGLKKPITVVRRSTTGQDGKTFDLVCGQGRIEELIALGETHIPSIVIEAPKEDQFLMSLVENIARRRPSNRDILREVKSLRDRGYSVGEIAKKFGMERMYISGIVHLVEHEEVALIDFVEAGKLPISVAVEIAHGKIGRSRRLYPRHIGYPPLTRMYAAEGFSQLLTHCAFEQIPCCTSFESS
jgi:ParB family chromosome partitioning protein